MTVREHVDVLKNLYYRGAPSDDRRFSDRFFQRILYAVRNRLIKEKIEKGGAISDDAYSYICVDLQNSNYHTCNCAENTCQYKRSILKLPNILNSKKGLAISVLNLNGEVLSQSDVDTNRYEKDFRLNNLSKQDIVWFYQNHYLFVLNGYNVKKLIIKAIFSEEPSSLEICTGQNAVCSYLGSQESFIPSDMEAQLYELSILLIAKTNQRGQDKMNDNIDSIESSAESTGRSKG